MSVIDANKNLDKAIKRLEAAVRDHEMLGANRPELHGSIRHELGRARSNLWKVIQDYVIECKYYENHP